MTGNVDLLIEKLSHDSLAHELVDQLRKSERQEWPGVLDDFLKSRLEQKVRELTYGEDQTP